MNKRILTICLALALCLSLIPVTAFAAVPLYTYQEIKTGVSATDISMLDNGYGSFKTKADDGELISKGVISPSGKVVLTRTPGENDPRYNMVDVSTNYASAGSVIADLLPVYDGPADTMMGEDFDFNLYSTDGKLITSAKKIIAAYEKMSEDDIVCSMTAYFGSDGYLTVFGNPDGYNVYAYIIDPQTQKVVFKQWSYEDTPRMGGESWNITSVNDGLIAYNHGESKESDAGYYGYEYIAAGWMDINGKHKISINTDKYSNWWNFSSDRAMVSNVTGLWYGYVDKTGKEVIPCKYSDGSMFKDGYAYVKEEDGRVGYIDTAGKTIIPFNYEYAFGYGDGLFTVGHAGQYDNYYGMVDINNTEVVPTVGYTDISVAKNGIAYAIKDDEIVILKFTKDEAAAKDVSNIFKDVPSNAWYKKYLQNAYDSKIVGGKKDAAGDPIYAPNGQLTHAEIMVIVANLHATQKGDTIPRVTGGHWAATYQSYCKSEGIIDARFDEGLDAPVTRAEMAYYFANALTPESYKEKQTISFSDMPENGYDEYIMKLAKADIVGGNPDGTYKPGDNVNRAQAAVFISNILDAIAENSAAGK